MSRNISFLPSAPYKSSSVSLKNSRFQSTNVALRVNQNTLDQFSQQPEIISPCVISSDPHKQCFAFAACFSSTLDYYGQLAVVTVECVGERDTLKFDVEVYASGCRLTNLSSKMPASVNINILPTMASTTTSERIYVCNFIVDVEPSLLPGEIKTGTSFAETVKILPEISPTIGVRRPRGRPPGKRSNNSKTSDSPTRSPKKRKSPAAVDENAKIDQERAEATPVTPAETPTEKKQRMLTEALSAPAFNPGPLTFIAENLLGKGSLSISVIEQAYRARLQKMQQKQTAVRAN